MKMTATDKWAGYLSRLDKIVHICMLLTKRMFLVKDKNVGLCLNMGRTLTNWQKKVHQPINDFSKISTLRTPF